MTKPTDCGLLVLNMDTGHMDGWYFSEALARDVLRYCRAERPGRWVLLRAVDRGPGLNSTVTRVPRIIPEFDARELAAGAQAEARATR